MSAFEGKDRQFDSWCEHENKKRLENKIKQLEQRIKELEESHKQKSIIKLCDRLDKAEQQNKELINLISEIKETCKTNSIVNQQWLFLKTDELLNKFK